MIFVDGNTTPAEVGVDDLNSLPFKPPDFSGQLSEAPSTGLPSRACTISGVLKPRWTAMAEGRISESYRKMSVEDQIEFKRWLKANAVVASIFCAAVFAIALVGAQKPETVDRTATGIRTTSKSEILASAQTKGPARAEELMSSVMNWLAANFDLPANPDAPRIEFIQPALMASIRYRGLGGNQAMPLGDIVAVYDDAKRTIYLPEGWTGVTPAEQSLLVHEMVHHLQNVGNLKYECQEAREKLAFAAQEKWLKLSDHTLASEFELDPFTLLVRTSCLG